MKLNIRILTALTALFGFTCISRGAMVRETPPASEFPAGLSPDHGDKASAASPEEMKKKKKKKKAKKKKTSHAS